MRRRGLKRKPSRAVERLRRTAAASANGAPANGAAPNGTPARPPAKVVSLLAPDLVLERTARRFLSQPLDRCVQSDSTFVGRAPAFIHCFSCAKLAPLPN